MGTLFASQLVGSLLLLGWSLASICQPLLQGPDAGPSSYSSQNARLPVEQVARKLQERNAQRAVPLGQFNGTRIYRRQYRGCASDLVSEVVVNVHSYDRNSNTLDVGSQM